MALDYSTFPLLSAPSAANSVGITPVSTAWANSSYVQIIASTSTAITISGIEVLTVGNNVDWEIDIATGASGSEVVVATFQGTNRTAAVGAPNSYYLPIPRLISASGQRISARLRKSSTTTTTWSVGLLYYGGNISSTAQTTTAVLKALPSAAAAATVNAGSGSWGNGAYTQIRAATGSALVLGGISMFAGVAQPYEIDVATGAAGSEVVIATFRGNWDSTAGVNSVNYAQLPIDNIPANTRVAVRARWNGSNTTAWRVKLLVYEKPI